MWSILVGIVVIFLAWKLLALSLMGLVWLFAIGIAIAVITRLMRRSNVR
jgi:hypothetical protein